MYLETSWIHDYNEVNRVLIGESKGRDGGQKLNIGSRSFVQALGITVVVTRDNDF